MKRIEQIQSEIDHLWKEYHALGESSPITVGIKQQSTRISFEIVRLEMEIAEIKARGEDSGRRRTG